jgi:hypothetical protein
MLAGLYMTDCEAACVLHTVYQPGVFGFPHVCLLMIIKRDLHVQMYPYLQSSPLHLTLLILARRLRWTLGTIGSLPLTVTRFSPLKEMANGRPALQHNTKLKYNALHISTAPGVSRHKILYDVMTVSVSFVNTGYSSTRHRNLPWTWRWNKITCPLVDVHIYQGRVHCLSTCGGVRLKHRAYQTAEVCTHPQYKCQTEDNLSIASKRGKTYPEVEKTPHTVRCYSNKSISC